MYWGVQKLTLMLVNSDKVTGYIGWPLLVYALDGQGAPGIHDTWAEKLSNLEMLTKAPSGTALSSLHNVLPKWVDGYYLVLTKKSS